jgi:hypothetical protein
MEASAAAIRTGTTRKLVAASRFTDRNPQTTRSHRQTLTPCQQGVTGSSPVSGFAETLAVRAPYTCARLQTRAGAHLDALRCRGV